MSEESLANSAQVSIGPHAAARIFSALDEPTPSGSLAPGPRTHPAGYSIDRRLGGGGGGEVYRAFREGSDRPVALKILKHVDSTAGEHEGGLNPFMQRARRELELLEGLHLPVVPMVLDYGVVPATGRLFIATEFVEGTTLEEFALGAREKSRASLALLIAKVRDAVQMLHERGVIHRDLKPSNILIDAHGEPSIIDLGIATILERGAGADSPFAFPTLTETGTPIGTPAYMAPEQARGERHLVSTRSDVYSLGATAYKLLTGATPHDTNTTIHEAIRRVAQDEPREPRTLEPTLPKSLSAVLSKACAREPEKRYAGAAEFGADLRRWANGEAVEAVPPGVWQRVVRWVGKRPIVATTTLCIVIWITSLASTFGMIWWLNQRPYTVTRYPDAREFRLVARSGNPLKTWSDTSTPSLEERFVAQRVAIPDEFGGGWVVVAVNPDAESAGIGPRQLAVWDPVSLAAPMWSTSPEDLHPPPGSLEGSRYEVSVVRITDVFSEVPGDEIIAIHTRDVSPHAIRVYSLCAGKVLFEAWHRGHIASIDWLSEPRLLVLAGMDNSHPWRHPSPQFSAFPPLVVFAVRPLAGERFGLLNTDARDPNAEHVRAWYKYLWPPEFIAQESLVPKFFNPRERPAESRWARLCLEHPTLSCSVQLDIGPEGRLISASDAGDWNHKFNDLSPDQFELLDVLPVSRELTPGK